MTRFAGFLAVGAFGFLVDAGVLWLALDLLNPYAARLVSFAAAVTATYTLNRAFVFRKGRKQPGWFAGLGRFVMSNSVGGAINLAVYSLLVFAGWGLVSHPIVATGIGSIAGAAANFTLTSLFVFPALRPDEPER